MKKLKEKLIEIDNGRFKNIIKTIDVKDICCECSYFVPDEKKAYRCRVTPFCIAATLSNDLQSYLLWKLGIINEDTHMKNLGHK